VADQRTRRETAGGRGDLLVRNAQQDDVDVARIGASPKGTDDAVARVTQRAGQCEAEATCAYDGYAGERGCWWEIPFQFSHRDTGRLRVKLMRLIGLWSVPTEVTATPGIVPVGGRK
jgi:hypothetical protein